MAAKQYERQVPDFCKQGDGLPWTNRITWWGKSRIKYWPLKVHLLNRAESPSSPLPYFNSPTCLQRIAKFHFNLDSTQSTIQGHFRISIFIPLFISPPHHNSRPFQGQPEPRPVLKTFPKTCLVSILDLFTNCFLGCIKRNATSKSKEVFVSLYSALMRPHLENRVLFLCPQH